MPTPTRKRTIWLTRQQAADELGVTLRSIARYIENGKLRAYKVAGNRVRIKAEDLDALLRPIASAATR